MVSHIDDVLPSYLCSFKVLFISHITRITWGTFTSGTENYRGHMLIEKLIVTTTEPQNSGGHNDS